MKKFLSIAALITIASLSSALAQGDDFSLVSSFLVSNTGYPLECLGKVLTNPTPMDYNSDAPRVELHGIVRGTPSTPIPPDDKGRSATNNPLLAVTSIGFLTSEDGLFCYKIPPEILTNCLSYNPDGLYRSFFFRVYDKNTVEASSYYADSSTFIYEKKNERDHPNTNVTFASKSLAPFPGTHPDSDGDGLSDEDELNKYGTKPDKADSDDDGIDDPTEIAYGLDPNNPIIITLSSEPVEGVASDSPEGKDWFASWPVSTNPKVHYRLEFVTNLLERADGTPVHPAETQVTNSWSEKSEFRSVSDTNWSEIVNDWVRTNSIGFMRIRMTFDTNAVSDGE